MNILGPTSSLFIPKPYKGPKNHPCHSKYYNNNNMTHVGQLFTLRGTIIHSTWDNYSLYQEIEPVWDWGTQPGVEGHSLKGGTSSATRNLTQSGTRGLILGLRAILWENGGIWTVTRNLTQSGIGGLSLELSAIH